MDTDVKLEKLTLSGAALSLTEKLFLSESPAITTQRQADVTGCLILKTKILNIVLICIN